MGATDQQRESRWKKEENDELVKVSSWNSRKNVPFFAEQERVALARDEVLAPGESQVMRMMRKESETHL